MTGEQRREGSALDSDKSSAFYQIAVKNSHVKSPAFAPRDLNSPLGKRVKLKNGSFLYILFLFMKSFTKEEKYLSDVAVCVI